MLFKPYCTTRPKFRSNFIKLQGAQSGVAERYKCFSNLSLLKGSHMRGFKRPKFLLTVVQLKGLQMAHVTWALRKCFLRTFLRLKIFKLARRGLNLWGKIKNLRSIWSGQISKLTQSTQIKYRNEALGIKFSEK